jgi:methionine-rich copper-binding protein CopC
MAQPQPGASRTTASAGAIALVAGVCWLAGLVGAAPAAAHASLVRSSPADGSSLATAPRIVTLTFDEKIAMPSVIVVTDADGARVTRGKTSVADSTASTRVSIAASGDYTVAFRVVSADGHPVAGRLRFSVETAGTASPGGPPGQVTAADGSHQESSTSNGGTRVIGMLAALGLLGGVALLTVRRWAPNLWSSS